MKITFAILSAFIIAINVTNGTVLTVSNDQAGGGQFNSLHAAYSAATNGDTLHLEGTNVSYFLGCGTFWEKSLTVIGIGFNPQKQNPRLTLIRNTDCHSCLHLRPGANGSKFYGIVFTK